MALHQQALDVDRVDDFLGGLDPHFDFVCSRILAMNLVSLVLEAYALVVEEDHRQSYMLGAGSVMAVKPYQAPYLVSSSLTTRGPKPDDAKGTRKCTNCDGDHFVKKYF